MNEEQRALLEMQLDNCRKLLDGKVSRLTCVDSKGNVTKKIVIEYHD